MLNGNPLESLKYLCLIYVCMNACNRALMKTNLSTHFYVYVRKKDKAVSLMAELFEM